MPHLYEDNSRSIGHTLLVRLNRVIDGAAAIVLGKVEGGNPAYSVKCRTGAALVWDAQERGLLGPARSWLNRPVVTLVSRSPSSRPLVVYR